MNLIYLTTCFGTPSHTFIRREIRELRKQGKHVELFGVRRDTAIADDAHDLVAETKYLYPLFLPAVILATLWANLVYLVTKPATYLRGIGMALSPQNGALKRRLKVLFHFLVSARFARQFEKQGVTHIHAHFLNVSSSIAMFASLFSNIPFSITIHSAGERDLPHVDAIALKLKQADKLLMISQYNIEYYNAIYPCAEKSAVVRCGMVMEQFVQRDFVPARSTPLKILAVGRFVEKKGFGHLIEAAKILRDKNIDAEIEILGSGPLEQDLYAKCETYALHNKVLLPGHASTEEVRSKMLAADIVVVPSVTSASGEMEGIPVVLMEAMASGVPVIGSAHSGIPELVTKETGHLVPEKNSAALADAIASFTPDFQTIEAARSLIASQFNITTVVKQRIDLFQ